MERTIRLGHYTIYCLHFLATVKQQVVKVYSHNQLLTLLSAATVSFNLEMTIKILWLICLTFTCIEKLTVCRVYRTGQTKKTRKFENIENTDSGVAWIYFLHLSHESLFYMKMYHASR